MDQHDIQLVDVEKILRSKAGKSYRFIPRVAVSYLKRLIHQEEVNQGLIEMKDLFGLDFLENVLIDRFELDIQVENPENIPAKGRYIVAANHPLGGLDGMALMHVIGKKRKDIKFLANDILLELRNLREMFLPVNKHGRNSAEYIRMIHEEFASDQMILIFPAGLVSRLTGKEIRDLEWKKTFINKAVQYQRDVIPVYIEGKNSKFFYNLARWRKRLGLKFNLEMLYLPNEMFKQKKQKIRIIFGKAIPYTTFTKELTRQEWAQKMKEHVYGLPEGKLTINA
ncbi:MAG: glycerol acyltransferase [Bacteroidia bacterium]|nr:MAG: glycerol acyltransferase [Bacteroidia bacterium]